MASARRLAGAALVLLALAAAAALHVTWSLRIGRTDVAHRKVLSGMADWTPSPRRDVDKDMNHEDSARVTPAKLGRTESAHEDSGLRVLCTLVKDEAEHIAEWINFHRAWGWNKFVIYDDNSSDSLEAQLGRFPSHEIELVKVDWTAARQQRHFQEPLQKEVFRKCFLKYWDGAQVISPIDVDEFIYPCTFRKGSPTFSSLLDYYLPTKRAAPVAIRMECYKFGMEGLTRAVKGSRVLKTYLHRALYADDQTRLPDYLFKGLQEIEFQNGFKIVANNAAKYLFLPNGVRANFTNPYRETNSPLPIQPSVHSYVGVASYGNLGNNMLGERSKPFCCNHYMFKSIEHQRAKMRKNRVGGGLFSLGLEQGVSSPIWAFYSQVLDTAAKEFYQQRIDIGGYVEL